MRGGVPKAALILEVAWAQGELRGQELWTLAPETITPQDLKLTTSDPAAFHLGCSRKSFGHFKESGSPSPSPGQV